MLKKGFMSDYELDKSSPKGTNQKLIALQKAELGGKIMREIATSIANTNNYLRLDNGKNKREKYKKVCKKTKQYI